MEEKTTNLSTGQQQFNLRWNNHTTNILQVFTEQLNNEALVDVTISCEGQYLKAHKMILSACSPYFQELFRVHTVSHPLIIINGMKYSDVKQVIDFMYRGEVKVLEADLESILAVAESLQVKGLSTVRNSYEKHDVSQTQTNDQNICEMPTPDQTVSSFHNSKKRKLSMNMDESTESVSDESLSSTIKIEPPEIRDIDQFEEKILGTIETERKANTPKPLKTSKSGRTIRPKSYDYTDSISIPKKISPNYTCHGFVDPANKALKIPRPPNAFMIFANEWRKKLATENPKDSNKEISIRLGVMWKSLGPDAKESYYSASRKADEEHKRKYPGYYYSPKEARIRKNLKETLTTNKSKKNCDAMRFIKVVMKDNNADADAAPERWRPSIEKEDDADDISVNVHLDSDEDTRSESALQIDTSPEAEADSSSPKE